MKKIISVLLCVLILASVTACGKKAPSVDEQKPVSTGGEQGKEQEDKPEDEGGSLANQEHVELVLYLLGEAPADAEIVQSKINEILEEKLNTTLIIRNSTWTDWWNTYNITLMSSDVDLIYSTNWGGYGLYSNAGAYLELDDLIDGHAPDIRKLYEQSTLDACRINGELYMVPLNALNYTSNGISYREDLRKKYDLPRPDSLENAEAYFKGILENEPNQKILAEGDASYVFNLKYPSVTYMNFTRGALEYGLMADYNDPTKVIDYWNSQNFIEDSKLLKSWADQGFWSRSILSAGEAANYDNGDVVAAFMGQNPDKHITRTLKWQQEHPDWEDGFIPFAEITGVAYPSHPTGDGTSITRSCENPERAMQVLELFLTDKELNQLIQYGIEGQHYTVENGVYQSLASTDLNPFPYEGFCAWNLRVEDFMLPRESDVMKNELIKQLGSISEKTKFPNIDIFGGFAENYDEYQTEKTAVQSVTEEYLLPLSAGLVSDVEKGVAEFLEKVNNANVEVCRENYIKQWLAYCEQQGYK